MHHLFGFRYLQRKRREKQIKSEEDGDSDLESVASDEFDEFLDKISGIPKDQEDLDFMNDIGANLKKKKHDNAEDDEQISEEDDDFKEGMSDEDEDLDMDETTEDISDEDNGIKNCFYFFYF